ncbi:MAG: hypothetical protein JWQ07_320 [Ramlibacter sp.]|nr:hypothetical protein [Ramlibacter sp.]
MFVFKRIVWIVGALLFAGTSLPAAAQAVYKCGWRSYSQQPCAPKRVVNTADAPVPAKSDRRAEENRVLAQSLRRLPGETSAQFATRRHRATLLQEDRLECSRLDTRIPFEKERMKNPNPEEVQQAGADLADATKRFRKLHC